MIYKKFIKNIILKIIFSIRKDLDISNKKLEYNYTIHESLKNMDLMDRTQLGQLIRFYGHNLDKATKCENKSEGRGEEGKKILESALNEWRQRGYKYGPDKIWAEKILERHRLWQSGEKPLIEFVHENVAVNNEIFSILQERRSLRFWKKKSVEREKIIKIVTAATHSPSSCNRMPWHFFVIENDINDIIEGDSTNQSMLEKAPVVIYVGIDERLYPEVYAPALDAGIALQSIVLATYALGLGSCLMYQSESIDQEKLKAKLDIPDYYMIYCAVLLGYPNEKPISAGVIPIDEACTFINGNKGIEYFTTV